jgi:hypothetical protein
MVKTHRRPEQKEAADRDPQEHEHHRKRSISLKYELLLAVRDYVWWGAPLLRLGRCVTN